MAKEKWGYKLVWQGPIWEDPELSNEKRAELAESEGRERIRCGLSSGGLLTRAFELREQARAERIAQGDPFELMLDARGHEIRDIATNGQTEAAPVDPFVSYLRRAQEGGK